MGRWAKTLRSRDQIVLFAPTLEDSISSDHSVRLFDEVMAQLDFGDWERRYERLDGQPPIHPRVLAGVILYGLSLGIRSSRKLEDATGNRIDFMWLTEGRTIDHSTLAGFRVSFEAQLKGLFRQIGRVAIGMGMANLNQVALDGTVKRANNSRYAVARRPTLERRLAALDEQIEGLMKQAAEVDRQEDELFGESSPMKLPAELRQLAARQERLAAALKKVVEIEQKQKAKGRLKPQGPATPTSDPDSSLMKNKTGGFAPNYLVVLATEGKNGLIMDYQVPAGGDEPSSVMPAMNHLREAFGSAEPLAEPLPQAAASAVEAEQTAGEEKAEERTEEKKEEKAAGPEIVAEEKAAGPQIVKELLADSNFNSGSNLAELKQAGITPWMAAKEPAEARIDPDSKLALNPRTEKIDKSAFIYHPDQDSYQCPAGRSLPFVGNVSERGVHYREYASADCSACPLASRCLGGRSPTRSIRRDEHQPLRDEMAARMAEPAGKAKYRRRSFLAETPFAVMNTTMNVWQLLLRGRDKVMIEFGWICSACNIKKLMGLLAASRLERQERMTC